MQCININSKYLQHTGNNIWITLFITSGLEIERVLLGTLELGLFSCTWLFSLTWVFFMWKSLTMWPLFPQSEKLTVQIRHWAICFLPHFEHVLLNIYNQTVNVHIIMKHYRTTLFQKIIEHTHHRMNHFIHGISNQRWCILRQLNEHQRVLLKIYILDYCWWIFQLLHLFSLLRRAYN